MYEFLIYLSAPGLRIQYTEGPSEYRRSKELMSKRNPDAGVRLQEVQKYFDYAKCIHTKSCHGARPLKFTQPIQRG